MSSDDDESENIMSKGSWLVEDIDTDDGLSVEVQNSIEEIVISDDCTSPPKKKQVLDTAVLAGILTDVDPNFIEQTWQATGENLDKFNDAIFDCFQTNTFPRVAAAGRPSASTALKVTLTCQCCHEDYPIDEVIECSKELHTTCKACVAQCCEVRVANAQFDIKCLTADCKGNIPIAVLKTTIPEPLYLKIQQGQQIADIEKAGVEGLETCPFCDYAYVPPENSTIFECVKEGCLKESCRLCRKESHVPLRCNDIEMEQDVRQKVEEVMTDTLLRTCNKCAKKYVKLDGCNKIVCHCGAIMCYLCRQTVEDYRHFNGQGGDETWKCPLWSDNEELHVRAVQEAGRRTMDEELLKNPDLGLIYDPTKFPN